MTDIPILGQSRNVKACMEVVPPGAQLIRPDLTGCYWCLGYRENADGSVLPYVSAYDPRYDAKNAEAHREVLTWECLEKVYGLKEPNWKRPRGWKPPEDEQKDEVPT